LLKLLASFLAALAIAAPADAEVVPNAPDTIAAAAWDCWQAANGPKLDTNQLEARGWKAGTMSTQDGKPVASPIRFYGKADSGVMLMEMDTPGAAGCVVLSPVAKPEDIGATAQLLMNRLQSLDPDVKGARQGQSIVYVSGQRVAELVPTGTMEKPATRIIIAYTTPEKK
jgi:hypothetical protein